MQIRPRRVNKKIGRAIDPMCTVFFDNLSLPHKQGMIRTMETIKRCQKEDLNIVIYKRSDELTVRKVEYEILRFRNDPLNKRVIVNDQFLIPYLSDDYIAKKELPGSTLPNVDFNVAAISYGYSKNRYRVEESPRVIKPIILFEN